MDTFFTLLKKSLVATVFIVFALVATYIPQPYNSVSEVEAGGVGGGSTLPLQITQNLNLIKTNIEETLTAGYTAISSFATNASWLKDSVGDGLGWALAKSMVSKMVSSLVSWINSGFEGRPAFVQDLQGFLLQAADETFGEYIQSLGSYGSFICSPFRLDIQISLELQYINDRVNQPATCTLSGIIDNIEGFIDGSFEEGGWKDWFRISSKPQTYTPYGAALTAQAGARAKLINAKEEEVKLLDFGSGFLSSTNCKSVPVGGGAPPRQDCSITTPGQTIADALSFNLDSGRQALIEADEINEIITALLGQIANKALTGSAGLLGLSGGSGPEYSGYNGSFLDQMDEDALDAFDIDLPTFGTDMREALAIQKEYLDMALVYEDQLNLYALNPFVFNEDKKEAARDARDDVRRDIDRLMGDYPPPFVPDPRATIGELEILIAEFEDPDATDDDQIRIAQQFIGLRLYTKDEVRTAGDNWDRLLR